MALTLSLAQAKSTPLCGENGAGKSTLIKILSGVHPAGSYDGDYLFCRGQGAVFHRSATARHAAFAMIYQELPLCEELSVAEKHLWAVSRGVPGLGHWAAYRRRSDAARVRAAVCPALASCSSR